MPSSRATIAAGTRPPRVMQTIASNGPKPLNRQASARESRWNWSQETGKIFAGCLAASPASTVFSEVWLIGDPCVEFCLSMILLGKPVSTFPDRAANGLQGAASAKTRPRPTRPISDGNHRWQSGNLEDRGLVGNAPQRRPLHHRLQARAFQDFDRVLVVHHRLCDENRARRGKSLHACRQIDGLAEVILAVVEDDREARPLVDADFEEQILVAAV